MADEFPGNSFAAKRIKVTEEGVEPKTTVEKEKIGPVINGKVEQRKKTLGARFKQHFVTEGEGFFDHIVEKVIIPKSLELFNTIVRQTADAFAQGVEEALFGGKSNRPTTPPRPGFAQRTNYNGVTAPSKPTATTTYFQPVVRRSNVVKDVVLEFREDVELVLDTLRGVIERHGHCTLGDFYQLVDIPTNPVDEEWGWTNLASARSREVNGGYLVVLPRLEHLSNGR
ncbi:hypothetical protein SscP1EGY_31 [Streptomyces phage SscP1EGY]|nr:hypothetical protein SscP1EGY_31 [Streptomyces phage SscP1EGY]